MNNKGFLQISFPWLFAIIVGILILFLAIYGVTKLIRTEETILGAKTSKEIGILLNPLETGFTKSTSISFPADTRMFNGCNLDGEFGRQLIRVSQKSRGRWTETDIDVGFSNKYIFSNKSVEGRKMLIFSKPFNFPFKVASLIYMTSSKDNYCFIDAPDDIKEELNFLNQENLLIEACSDLKNVIKICFAEASGCDIKVDYSSGSVEKRDGKVYFTDDSLMYAGIFADKDTYECQLKRLMKRVNSLATLYNKKSNLIARVDCNTNIRPELSQLDSVTDSFSNSVNLFQMTPLVDTIDRKNKDSLCKLW